MTFWKSVDVEPKRSFRFLLDLGADGTSHLASYFIKAVKKPNFTMDATQEVKYIGHTFKYPGRVKWEDITVTIIDPASPDAAVTMMNILSNSGYQTPKTEALAKETVSKKKSAGALGAVQIRQINANGSDIEKWFLHNAFLQNVDFGELSYENDDIVSYTLTISYDHATMSRVTGVSPNPDPRIQSTST